MISSSGRPSASCSAGASAMCCSTICSAISTIRSTSSRIWQGGMSFHGGLLGVILAMIAVCPSSAASAPGRCSTSWRPACRSGSASSASPTSSMRELWGRATDVPWGVVRNGVFRNRRVPSRPRHPSQLYEALLEGVVLFLVLRFLTHSRLKLKTPRLRRRRLRLPATACRASSSSSSASPTSSSATSLGGWLTMGMVLSLPMVLAGIWAMATARQVARSRSRHDAAEDPHRRPDRCATARSRVNEYMALCLFDPSDGYYTTREPFGARRRLRHRAGDQPDVRRTDRASGCIRPGRRSAGRCRSPSPRSAPAAAR